MKLSKIVNYFEYLREDDTKYPEQKCIEVLKNLDIEQYEQVSDIPVRVLDDLFNELIGGDKMLKMNPNQEQDILDLIEECSVKGAVNLNVTAKILRYLLRKDVSKKTALLIIDVQNDFIDGSLALKHSPAHEDGTEVVSVINDIIDSNTFDLVVYSIDWHPEDHCSFISNVGKYTLDKTSKITADDAKVFDHVVYEGEKVLEQVLWPVHCVQGSKGAELHPDLKELKGENAFRIYKGTHSEVDSYSAFWDNGRLTQTDLFLKLIDRDITTVFTCGLATDFCVAYTTLDSKSHGFDTFVIDDACRGVDYTGIEEMKEKECKCGIKVIQSSELSTILTQ